MPEGKQGMQVSVRSAVLYGALILVVLFAVAFFLIPDEEGAVGGYGAVEGEDCNVVVVPIYGALGSYVPKVLPEDFGDVVGADDIVSALEFLDKDPATKAVILAIDSGGGDGVAGEEVANALRQMEKPTVAVVRTIAASAAYWAATGADMIYASRISDVGSIGVTMSYLDDTQKNEAEGYKYIELASGKYKDIGNIGKELTEDERELLLSDIKKVHEVFVDQVAQNRNLPRADVAAFADGRTFLGEDAIALGLVDAIGDISTAVADLAGYIEEEPVVCWY